MNSKVAPTPSQAGLPNFFIMGAPKCGTTSLHEWLSANPQVHAPHKETCFFSQDIFSTAHLRSHIPSLAAYRAIFADAPNGVCAVGEATPKYLYSDNAITEIRRLCPNARLIVCLRDPADFAISYHNQMLVEGVETEPDFEVAWLRCIKQDGITPITLKPIVNGHINYTFWGSFGSRLQRLMSVFPKSQVRIVLLDEIRTSPEETYRGILAFLGVAEDDFTRFTVANERKRIRNLHLHRTALLIKQAAEPVLGPIRKARGGKGTGILKAINSVNTVPGIYTSQLGARCRLAIYKTLSEDITLAEQYLDGRRLVN